jgi:hypothetical protein
MRACRLQVCPTTGVGTGAIGTAGINSEKSDVSVTLYIKYAIITEGTDFSEFTAGSGPTTTLQMQLRQRLRDTPIMRAGRMVGVRIAGEAVTKEVTKVAASR